MFVERFLVWIDTAPEDKRAEAASALARAYLQSIRSDEESQQAEAAMSVLLDDPAPQVRMALARVFAAEPEAPRHVVMSLAMDSAEIASLILARSPVFLDSELVDIIGADRVEAQICIACRPVVSPVVAAAIAEVGHIDAVAALLTNPGAETLADSLHRMAERFGDETQIRRMLLQHALLRPRTRILLIRKLGESMEDRAEAEGALAPTQVSALSRDSVDKAIISYAARAGEDDLAEITETMIADGRMTTAFLLRAICMGNISLFAHALAALSGMPLSRIEAVLIRDQRSLFRALYRKAGLPDAAFGVFASALDTWRRVLARPDAVEPERLACEVTSAVLRAYNDAADPSLDGLLVLLRRLAADAARDNARRDAARIVGTIRDNAMPALPAPEADEDVEAAERIDDIDQVEVDELPERIELPEEVVFAFALFFAEEIAELEAEIGLEEQTVSDAEIEAQLAIEIDALDIGDPEPVKPPEDFANDETTAPDVRAVGSSLPKFEPGEPANEVVGKVRSYMRSRVAA